MVSGYAACRYSEAATAAPFSVLAQTALPISKYNSTCGNSSTISRSSTAYMAL